MFNSHRVLNCWVFLSFLCAGNAAIAQAATPVAVVLSAKKVSPDHPLEPPFQLNTVAGRLAITQSGDMPVFEFHITLNGNDLFTDNDDQSLNTVLVQPVEHPSLLVLQLSSGGTACPARYRLLDLGTKPKPFLSDEIGNCSDLVKLVSQKNKLLLNFPKIGGAEAERWSYTLADPKHAGLLKKVSQR